MKAKTEKKQERSTAENYFLREREWTTQFSPLPSLVPRPSITANAVAVIEGLGTRLSPSQISSRGAEFCQSCSEPLCLGTRLALRTPVLTISSQAAPYEKAKDSRVESLTVNV